jgi:hypothetical protein
MKIPEICCTKQFKIGLLAGLGIAASLTTLGFFASKVCERKREEEFRAALDDEQKCWFDEEDER